MGGVNHEASGYYYFLFKLEALQDFGVDRFCTESQLNMAFNIFNLMNSISLKPKGLTFIALIDGLSKQGRLEQANGILGSIWN